MTQDAPREIVIDCRNEQGGHRMVVHDWGGGDPENSAMVVCVHGLTRNGRDFDYLAETLSHHYRVLAPDIVGRGRSDHLPAGAAYGYPQYLADIAAMREQLEIDSCDWVGTSMGGLIGMTVAAGEDNPIGRLVLNDIGPMVPKAALERIGQYVGKDPEFHDLQSAEAYFREVNADFGPLTDVQWWHLTRHSVAWDPQRHHYRLVYDPRIAEAFQGEMEDVELWEVWQAIDCPALVLRGERSDLLRPETAAEMKRTGPKAEVVEIPDCGHAPALMDPHQTDLVRDWLLGLHR